MKARGLCSRHHQAHYVRGKPFETLLPGAEAGRIENGSVKVQTRIPESELLRLQKAIKEGKVKGTQYSFIQRSIRDAIKAL